MNQTSLKPGGGKSLKSDRAKNLQSRGEARRQRERRNRFFPE
jgi:hypothetical protein